jgi:hypothetical protein
MSDYSIRDLCGNPELERLELEDVGAYAGTDDRREFLNYVCDMVDARETALDADDDARNAAEVERLRGIAEADCDRLNMTDAEQRRRYVAAYEPAYERARAEYEAAARRA